MAEVSTNQGPESANVITPSSPRRITHLHPGLVETYLFTTPSRTGGLASHYLRIEQDTRHATDKL